MEVSNSKYYLLLYVLLKISIFNNIPLFLFNFTELDCINSDGCPRTMCRYPLVARCISYFCECVIKRKSLTKGYIGDSSQEIDVYKN
jgi:hypothetical protein